MSTYSTYIFSAFGDESSVVQKSLWKSVFISYASTFE